MLHNAGNVREEIMQILYVSPKRFDMLFANFSSKKLQRIDRNCLLTRKQTNSKILFVNLAKTDR